MEYKIEGQLHYHLQTRKSRIHGRGAFAGEMIPARKKIGSLGGQIITKKEARSRAKLMDSVSIVELWNGKALDATDVFNDLKFINHSCKPNTFMRTIGYHVEFYALRKIRKDEELTCNYGETHHEGQKACACGAPGCKGFI